MSLRSFMFVLAVGMSATVMAANWPPSVTTTPEKPDSHSLVMIRVSGTWHDNCTPRSHSVNAQGPEIDVRIDKPLYTSCLPTSTPREEIIYYYFTGGPGTYMVHIALQDGSFDVTEQSPIGLSSVPDLYDTGESYGSFTPQTPESGKPRF
jgi:hypothetical protein